MWEPSWLRPPGGSLTSEPLDPDPRMAFFVGGLDAAGQPHPLARSDLEQLSSQWPTSPATPVGVAELLSTSRALFVLAWFRYELLLVSVMWSLLAVEAVFACA